MKPNFLHFRIFFCSFLLAVAWPVQAQTNVARTGRFTRGTGADPTYHSFVIGLDFQKGVQIDDIGGNGYDLFGGAFSLIHYHYNATNPASGTSTNGRIAYESPIVAFGSRMGGSPLYVGQQYRFGIFSGIKYWGTNYPSIYIDVYDKSEFDYLGCLEVAIPNREDTNAWRQFASNGCNLTVIGYGLKTTISRSFLPRWGSTNEDSYILLHEADVTATNLIFDVFCLGYADSGEEYYPMVLDDNGIDTDWSELYTIEFDQRPSSRAIFIDQPHFDGEPLPPEYAGKNVEELTNLLATLTNRYNLTTNSAYTNLDNSPELRRHPILDKFVTDMHNDPLALTAFVLNEIELTDPLAFGEAGQMTSSSVALGGVNRSALGTFLERQGSPWEQCALLVYLLRAAGQHAAYVFPTNQNLQMLDSRMSKLLRIQLRGTLLDGTWLCTTSHLITVQYPWVVANINSNQCVHIFPWLKDTEVDEGFNLYDFMPTNYDSGFKWVRQYLKFDTNISSLSSETDVPRVLFPRFVEQSLLDNYPEISIDDLGVNAYNRRHSYARWEDLPKPSVICNPEQVTLISDLTDVTNKLMTMRQPFDLVKVEVLRNTTKILDTGDLRMCDLQNRKFLLYTNSGKLNLWLASYRPSITNQSSFGLSDPGLLNKQLLQVNLVPNDTQFTVRLSYRRHLSISNAASAFGVLENLVFTNDYTFKKEDIAGICLNPGRIAIPMLQMHAESYWQTERNKQLHPTISPSIPDYQGAAAYLMGMGYFEKDSRFDAVNQRLHKIRRLTVCEAGLAKIANKKVGTTNQVQPGVDMVSLVMVYAGNRTLHPDSAIDEVSAPENYRWLSIANGSAEEHAIINSSFSETNALSTVGLLRLAQRRSNANRAGIIELDINNYKTRGNMPSTGYGTNWLKNYDPRLWGDVTNAFLGPDGNYVKVYITPASITNVPNSYKGMGALIYAPTFSAALISPNQRGGAGSYQPTFYPEVDTQPYVSYSLYQTQDNSFTFSHNDITAPTVIISTPTYVLANYTDGSWDLAPSPSQTENANFTASQLNLDSPSYKDTIVAQQNYGSLGGSWLRSDRNFVADPVSTLTGEFYIDTVDLSVPGIVPLEIRRNYLSQNLTKGHFGEGWKLNFMPYLVLTTNKQNAALIYAAELDGSVVTYRKTNNIWRPEIQDNPLLSNNNVGGKGSIANMFNAHIIHSNGTYRLNLPDGSLRVYVTNSYPIITASNRLDRMRPYLTEWWDHSGNAYHFLYGRTPTMSIMVS